MAVRATRGVAFARAGVGHGTPAPHTRALLMDVYEPTEAGAARRPAVILAFGGAFHRGTRDADQYEEDGHRNTPVADYCRRLAARGLVAFAIDYRLVPEAPEPVADPVRRVRAAPPRGRIDHVRALLGLPPATDRELLDGAEAAYHDVALACRFVHDHAARWAVDPARLALGGFSSGGTAALYAAYARGAPAAALVVLSGMMAAEDIAHYVRPGGPPALLIAGERDLAGIEPAQAALAAQLRRCEIGCARYHVPGAPHFYPRTAPVQSDRAAENPGTVEDAIAAFLAGALSRDG